MEGITDISVAYQLMGENMIGPAEIIESNYLNKLVKIDESLATPPIPYSDATLRAVAHTHLLILVTSEGYNGGKLCFSDFRRVFGVNPNIYEPCLYNQDWYLNELFYIESTLDVKWVLIAKNVSPSTRAVLPESFDVRHKQLPSAILCTFIFFAFFLCKSRIIWVNDFVWCCDRDTNGDQLYVGRYIDPSGKSKRGFSIHRHLTVTPNYGAVDILPYDIGLK